VAEKDRQGRAVDLQCPGRKRRRKADVSIGLKVQPLDPKPGRPLNYDPNSGSFESTLAVNGPVVQVGKYLSGVGTEGIPLFKLVEESLGAGIAEQIVWGYTFLSRNYEPGDESSSLASVAAQPLRAASPVSSLDRAS
jgi:hypothetical protein